MTEQATVEAPVAAKKGIARASGLNLVLPDGTKLKPMKYPMPLKAARFPMSINGKECDAAQTTYRDIKYTYFMYEGASFYVPGHLDPVPEYTLEFNEGYTFAPSKMDRKLAAEKAKKADKTEGATETPATEQAAADPEPAAEAAPVAPQKKGKKASR